MYMDRQSMAVSGGCVCQCPYQCSRGVWCVWQDRGTVEARLREYPGLESLIGAPEQTADVTEDDNDTPTRKVDS